LLNKNHLKNVGPIRHASRRTPIQQVSLPVLSRAACASMSTTTTTTTRDRGDRYGPMEWAQQPQSEGKDGGGGEGAAWATATAAKA